MRSRLRRILNLGGSPKGPGRAGGLPFDMFDGAYTDAEARRARRLESIYHVGQDRIWDGRAVLSSLVEKHGRPRLGDRETRALGRIFSIIMWGELAAWKISAQLADVLVDLEPKMAAASQVHDEARHFYVMHDYLEALGYRPPPLDFWSRRVVEMTLGTDDVGKKLMGMQLTIETIALTIFQRVREMNVEPVLSELLPYYERDEARHVGLGTQLVPAIVKDMGVRQAIDFVLFELDLLFSTLMGLKAMEPDLLSIGVDPRSILAIGFRKQTELNREMRHEFPWFPEDPPVDRAFHGMCEALFPTEGSGVRVPPARRVAHAMGVVARTRKSVLQTYDRHHAAAP